MSNQLTSGLEEFIPSRQLAFIRELAKGEEGQFYIDKMAEMQARWKAMPVTYSQDSEEDPTVHLHYLR